jgi:hypothetical protein
MLILILSKNLSVIIEFPITSMLEIQNISGMDAGGGRGGVFRGGGAA